MKRLLNKPRQGQGGFTLVEVLVVIAILGIMATVALLAITNFIGTGNLEAARTEFHQAQTAINALLADAGVNQLDAGGVARTTVGWNGAPNMVLATPAGSSTPLDAADYVHGLFKACYKVDDNGRICGIGNGGHAWSGIHWDNNIGNWVEE